MSAYWPIKGEPDLRGWLAAQHATGAVTALPVVETKAAPLVFREWTPETKMVRGDWNIPVPPAEAPSVAPEITLPRSSGGTSRDTGWAMAAAISTERWQPCPRILTIGVGLQEARLKTIYPQPHDVRLDAIVTEAGMQFSSKGLD